MASKLNEILEKLVSKENKDRVKNKVIIPLMKEISKEFQPYFFFVCGMYLSLVILLLLIIIILIILFRKLSKV